MATYSLRRGQPDFNPLKDIPNLRSRVCLIVGSTSGLGEATAIALAQHNPNKLYLTARSRAKADSALSRIRASSKSAEAANIEFLDHDLDLSSFQSVRRAATELTHKIERLDLVHISAGVGLLPHATTTDGYEIQFATNYLGHALLIQLLISKLLYTTALPGADVRIISMSSQSHKTWARTSGILFGELKTPMASRSVFALYGQSTPAKALFAYELSKRYPQITSVSLHPGGVNTNVFNGEKAVNWLLYNVIIKPIVRLTGITPEEGAKTQVWCSVSPHVQNDQYYEPIGLLGCEGNLTRDDDLSSRLWTWTDGELQASGSHGWEQA